MSLVRMMRACRRCGLVCAANHCLRTAQRSLAGTLIKIHLENFMCHKNLTIEFVRSLWCHSSRVVRIASLGSGTADSGRQYHQRREWVGQKCGVCCPHGACALVCVCVNAWLFRVELTQLCTLWPRQMVLGSKASKTSRGSNAKGIIRHGAVGSARIVATFNNVGKEGFRPSVFGPRLIIERVISQCVRLCCCAVLCCLVGGKAALANVSSCFPPGVGRAHTTCATARRNERWPRASPKCEPFAST